MTLPLVERLWVIPLVGAVVIIALPRQQDSSPNGSACSSSLVVLAVSIVVAAKFSPGGAQYQFVESHRWIPAFGAGYILGVDGIAWSWCCSPRSWCRCC